MLEQTAHLIGGEAFGQRVLVARQRCAGFRCLTDMPGDYMFGL
jgi:hypothetical protein